MKSTILRNKLVLSHVRGPHDARTSEGLKEQHIAYRTFLNVYRRLLVSGCTQSNRGYPRTFRTRSCLSRGTNLLRADAHQYWLSKRNPGQDRKSTRLNSSHVSISYAVFCLKKKNTHKGRQE